MCFVPNNEQGVNNPPSPPDTIPGAPEWLNERVQKLLSNLKVLIPEGQPVELRCLRKGGPAETGAYSYDRLLDLAHFAAMFDALDLKGVGCYVTFNPFDPALCLGEAAVEDKDVV